MTRVCYSYSILIELTKLIVSWFPPVRVIRAHKVLIKYKKSQISLSLGI